MKPIAFTYYLEPIFPGTLVKSNSTNMVFEMCPSTPFYYYREFVYTNGRELRLGCKAMLVYNAGCNTFKTGTDREYQMILNNFNKQYQIPKK